MSAKPDVTDPAIVARLIESLDGEYDDAHDVFISVSPDGRATTSASCEVTLTSWGESQVFRVSVTMPEPGDDDYDGEED